MKQIGLSEKIVVIMCGLPGRGKSSIAAKLTHYLNWQGYKTQMFNVGNYRRARHKQPEDFHFLIQIMLKVEIYVIKWLLKHWKIY